MRLTKLCYTCKLEIPREQFYKDKIKKDGLSSSCKSCCLKNTRLSYDLNRDRKRKSDRNWYRNHMEKRRAYSRNSYAKHEHKHQNRRYKKKYGISYEEYLEKMKAQNNLCAICGFPESRKQKNGELRGLSLDHSHETKQIRGGLCCSCNLGLGYFKDDIIRLEQAISYLKAWKIKCPA